ncbi:MAG: CapA family protein [Clostridium sp.]
MSKNKNKKLFAIFIISSLTFMCVLGFSIYKIIETASLGNEKKSNSSIDNLKKKNPKNQIEKKAETSNDITITISGVGDCTLGSDINSKGNSFDSVYKKKKDPSYFFTGVYDVLSKDDITIANLEGPLTSNGKRADKEFSFRGRPEYTGILTKGSVDAVTLANNHSMDYGQVGFDDTKKYLEDASINWFGYNNKSIMEKKGVKIGLLGFKAWNNSNELKNNVKVSIDKLKKDVDMIVVSFHWGEEGAMFPNSIQTSLGRLAIDSGAELVLGHHPHVIQGIESYKGKNIIYSLGNFSFGGNSNPKDKDAYIFQQKFTFDSSQKLISQSNGESIPVSISSSRNINDYRPIVLKGSEKERVLSKINNRSKIIN